MPATDHQSSPLSSVGRSLLSVRRDQVHAMNNHSDGHQESSDLESFQRHVADLLAAAASASASDSGELLSLSWIRKLLEYFLLIQEEFLSILLRNSSLLRPPLDRFVSDFFERSVKALDVCNAIRDGIDQVRQWKNHLEIVVAALNAEQKLIGEGQIRRAKKALTDLTILMLDDKESGSAISCRNRSFGLGRDRSGPHFRSLSWSVSRSWSAARQLQAIGANLSAPRSNEIVATYGLIVPIYTMSSVLLFVMWALVAAIPCQDRGLNIHFSMPRNFSWAVSISSMHERILEESRKRDRRNASGLLKEIRCVERCMRKLNELTDNVQSPMAEDKVGEVREQVKELKEVCEVLKEDLESLEKQVREVFHRIVRSRSEGLDCLNNSQE